MEITERAADALIAWQENNNAPNGERLCLVIGEYAARFAQATRERGLQVSELIARTVELDELAKSHRYSSQRDGDEFEDLAAECSARADGIREALVGFGYAQAYLHASGVIAGAAKMEKVISHPMEDAG